MSSRVTSIEIAFFENSFPNTLSRRFFFAFIESSLSFRTWSNILLFSAILSIKVNPTLGVEMDKPLTASVMAFSSDLFERRNFSRAGVA